MWCWRKLLRIPWTARRSNQSILKEINPECSSEGLMQSWSSNYLATWCEELTHWKRPWCWERLRAGGEGDNGEWDGWMASPSQWTWVWANSGRWWRTGKPGMLPSMWSQRAGHNLATEQQLPPGFLEYQSTDDVTQKRQLDLLDAFLSLWRGKMAQFPTLRHTEAWDISLYYGAILGFPCGSVGKESTSNAGDRRVWALDSEYTLEEAVAMHSSILAWRIPRTEEPGRLQFIRLQRVGCD